MPGLTRGIWLPKFTSRLIRQRILRGAAFPSPQTALTCSPILQRPPSSYPAAHAHPTFDPRWLPQQAPHMQPHPPSLDWPHGANLTTPLSMGLSNPRSSPHHATPRPSSGPLPAQTPHWRLHPPTQGPRLFQPPPSNPPIAYPLLLSLLPARTRTPTLSPRMPAPLPLSFIPPPAPAPVPGCSAARMSTSTSPPASTAKAPASVAFSSIATRTKDPAAGPPSPPPPLSPSAAPLPGLLLVQPRYRGAEDREEARRLAESLTGQPCPYVEVGKSRGVRSRRFAATAAAGVSPHVNRRRSSYIGSGTAERVAAQLAALEAAGEWRRGLPGSESEFELSALDPPSGSGPGFRSTETELSAVDLQESGVSPHAVGDGGGGEGVDSAQLPGGDTSRSRSGAHTLIPVFVNDVLSPLQERTLERQLGCPVMDRVGLIIRLFAQRARTREARLQVELASLTYQLPRLVRSRGVDGRRGSFGGGLGWADGGVGPGGGGGGGGGLGLGFYGGMGAEVVSARQRGRSGAGGLGGGGGAGDPELRQQRYRITRRLTALRRELRSVAAARGVQRQGRRAAGLPTLAIVGYTNVGKTSLTAALCPRDAGVAAPADMLFATLDPCVRRAWLPSRGSAVAVSDTVGFIRDLPLNLVAAFRATLEEVIAADGLIHVLDASSPNVVAQRATVLSVLRQLGVDEQVLWCRTIEVWNKVDLMGGGAEGGGSEAVAAAGMELGREAEEEEEEGEEEVGEMEWCEEDEDEDGGEAAWGVDGEEEVEHEAWQEGRPQEEEVVGVRDRWVGGWGAGGGDGATEGSRESHGDSSKPPQPPPSGSGTAAAPATTATRPHVRRLFGEPSAAAAPSGQLSEHPTAAGPKRGCHSSSSMYDSGAAAATAAGARATMDPSYRGKNNIDGDNSFASKLAAAADVVGQVHAADGGVPAAVVLAALTEGYGVEDVKAAMEAVLAVSIPTGDTAAAAATNVDVDAGGRWVSPTLWLSYNSIPHWPPVSPPSVAAPATANLGREGQSADAVLYGSDVCDGQEGVANESAGRESRRAEGAATTTEPSTWLSGVEEVVVVGPVTGTAEAGAAAGAGAARDGAVPEGQELEDFIRSLRRRKRLRDGDA